jgi:ribulose-phosphate 3-epimerase
VTSTRNLAASILAADFAHLADQVAAVEPFVDLLHIDAMDGHFVPPLTVGPVVVAALRTVTNLPLHCHLQVERPHRLFEAFAEAGADIVSVHVETVGDAVEETIAAAGSHGLRVGLAVSPETPVKIVVPHLEVLDRVVVMSVHPGYGGQPFIEAALPRIEAVRTAIERRGLGVEVEVDGGVDAVTGPRCVAAGATVLAAGTAIFGGGDAGRGASRLAGALASVAAFEIAGESRQTRHDRGQAAKG